MITRRCSAGATCHRLPRRRLRTTSPTGCCSAGQTCQDHRIARHRLQAASPAVGAERGRLAVPCMLNSSFPFHASVSRPDQEFGGNRHLGRVHATAIGGLPRLQTSSRDGSQSGRHEPPPATRCKRQRRVRPSSRRGPRALATTLSYRRLSPLRAVSCCVGLFSGGQRCHLPNLLCSRPPQWYLPVGVRCLYYHHRKAPAVRPERRHECDPALFHCTSNAASR